MMARFPTIRLFPIQTVCLAGNSNMQTTSPNNHVLLVATTSWISRLNRHTISRALHLAILRHNLIFEESGNQTVVLWSFWSYVVNYLVNRTATGGLKGEQPPPDTFVFGINLTWQLLPRELSILYFFNRFAWTCCSLFKLNHFHKVESFI